MKRVILFLCLAVSSFASAYALDVSFSFANPQITHSGGSDFYEVDVMISTSTPFKLGSGLLYFNYNTAAFGSNVLANGQLTISHSAGYILGQKDNFIGLVNVYGDFVANDNSSSRFAYSWQQSKEGDCINVNVNGGPALLFHLKIKYLNTAQSPGVCFESGPVFVGQTFTHCGPNDGTCLLGDEDCFTTPGTQIQDDNFDCTNAGIVLPVELTAFGAKAKDRTTQLTWTTATEVNSDRFEVEHCTDGVSFEKIGEVPAAGNSTVERRYTLQHLGPLPGVNYYRLRQIDFGGAFEYSRVVGIEIPQLGSGDALLHLYPNPTAGLLYLELPEDAEYLLEVFDMTGRRVEVSRNGNTLDLRHLQPGNYLLRASDIISGKTMSNRIVVAK